jgi:sec-independent protein translocase protein TatC
MSQKEENLAEDGNMTLIEHLVELRDRLVYSLIAIFFCFLVTFYYNEEIWNVLVAPVQEAIESSGKGSMAVHSLLEGILNKIKVGFLGAILCASPIVSYQSWKYIAPALYPSEKHVIIPMAIASTLLFFLGVFFGYFIIFDFVFVFLLEQSQENVTAVISINDILATTTKLLTGFGLTFQLPVIAFFLARVGLIDHIDMLHFFRYAIVAIFIVSAFLTPPDPLSQLLMSIPLCVLYIIGIGVAWMFTTKERLEEQDELVKTE